MAKNDQAEKKQLLADGNELPGLVNLGEYIIEDGTIRVPGLKTDVPVRNGVQVVPEIEAVFKITRGSETLQILKDWYYKNETHEITIIRTDGAGIEFAREIWQNVECGKIGTPGFDASSPTYAQISVKFLPEKIIPIGAA